LLTGAGVLTKILVIGIAGRMGKTIVECIDDTDGVELSGGTERTGSHLIGQDAGEISGLGKKGVAVSDDLAKALEGCDVVIDFTTPESSMVTLLKAADKGKSVVVGTTGFSAKQKKEIAELAKNIPLVVAPNMSIGVNWVMIMMLKLLRLTISLRKIRPAALRFAFLKLLPIR
jgi:4-hydroxy-tetrahydrodipicolinate reductase